MQWEEKIKIPKKIKYNDEYAQKTKGRKRKNK
jgi:hypothetical protein